MSIPVLKYPVHARENGLVTGALPIGCFRTDSDAMGSIDLRSLSCIQIRRRAFPHRRTPSPTGRNAVQQLYA